jgi:hypothetical protein
MSRIELAERTGYNINSLSLIFRNPNFRKRYEERKHDLIDPILQASSKTRFESLVDVASEVLIANLTSKPNANTALRSLDIASRALGMGAERLAPTVNTYVAIVPERAKTTADWVTTAQQTAQSTPERIEPLPGD